MSDFDTLVGPSASERARTHARTRRSAGAASDKAARPPTPRIRTAPRPAEPAEPRASVDPQAAYNKGLEVGRDAERGRRRPAATPRPVASRPAPRASGSSDGVWKTLILAEMLGLLAAGLISVRDPATPALVQLLSKNGLKRVLAVVVLLVLLMLAADLGFGAVGAVFGGLLVLGYLSSRGGLFGDKLLALERRAFG